MACHWRAAVLLLFGVIRPAIQAGPERHSRPMVWASIVICAALFAGIMWMRSRGEPGAPTLRLAGKVAAVIMLVGAVAGGGRHHWGQG